MAGSLQSEKWMSWAGVIGETVNDALIGKYLRARLGFTVRAVLGINDVAGARLWCWWLPQAGSLGRWPLPLYFIFGQKFHLSPKAKLLMEAALLSCTAVQSSQLVPSWHEAFVPSLCSSFCQDLSPWALGHGVLPSCQTWKQLSSLRYVFIFLELWSSKLNDSSLDQD